MKMSSKRKKINTRIDGTDSPYQQDQLGNCNLYTLDMSSYCCLDIMFWPPIAQILEHYHNSISIFRRLPLRTGRRCQSVLGFIHESTAESYHISQISCTFD
jgi:hypothetical protein